MIYTTFSLLRQHDACESGYRKLAKHLGGVNSYGRDTPIALAVVLDSNGLDDALWCLRATTEPCERLARLLAVAFVRDAGAAAWDAAGAAARDAAGDTGAAAWAAAGDARDAARAAASNAARDAMRTRQAQIMHEMLEAQ